MAIKIKCGKCEAKFSVKDAAAGRRVKCRECGAPIRVPVPKTDEEELLDFDASDGDGDGEEYQPYVPRSRKRKKRKEEEESLVPEEQGFFTGFGVRLLKAFDKENRSVEFVLLVAVVGATIISFIISGAIDIVNGDIVSGIGLWIAPFVPPLIYYSSRRCRKCKQNWAYENTGNTREGGLLKSSTGELQCRFCGHSKWVSLSRGEGE